MTEDTSELGNTLCPRIGIHQWSCSKEECVCHLKDQILDAAALTRDEHLTWCKKRAIEYLDRGDVPSAIASMGSDLSKHDELRQIGAVMMPMGLFYAMNYDINGARRWIEGFR